MELWVIRHAPAVARSTAVDDAKRPLTPKGRKRWQRGVRGLESKGVCFDALYSSPWTRSRQTAELLAPLVKGDAVELSELTRSPDAALLERLSGERVAVVGHSPWLQELLSLLVVGSIDVGRGFVLKKAGVACLEGEPRAGRMELAALYPPQVLVDLSRL
jgi:phosphohistidine phosphatase